MHPSPWTPRTTFWWLLGGLLLAIIVPPLVVAPFDPDLDSDGALLAAQAIFDGLLLCVAVGVASDWQFRPLARPLRLLGLRRSSPPAIGWMLAILVAYYVAAASSSRAWCCSPTRRTSAGAGVCNPSIGIAVAAVLVIVVLAPFAEELFFRGFFFAGLRSRWSLWPAALLSGAIFGLVHAPTGPTAAIPLAGLGVGLCLALQQDRVAVALRARPHDQQRAGDQRGDHAVLGGQPPAAVHARDLTKSYGERVAVAGIDFEVEPGICFGFLGPERGRARRRR